MVLTPATPSPTATLTWNNAFDIVPTSSFQVTYNGVSLLGGAEASVSIELLQGEATSSDASTDYAYNVTNLHFFTEYNFTIVAIYNLTGVRVLSDAVQVSNIETAQGGMLFL